MVFQRVNLQPLWEKGQIQGAELSFSNISETNARLQGVVGVDKELFSEIQNGTKTVEEVLTAFVQSMLEPAKDELLIADVKALEEENAALKETLLSTQMGLTEVYEMLMTPDEEVNNG